MEYSWIKLPLYDSWDYEYKTTLINTPVTIRLYYSDRAEKWAFDIRDAEDEAIQEGEYIIPLNPTFRNVIEDKISFLWLEPVSDEINQTVLHPSQLHKYYNLYFIYRDVQAN